MGPARAASGDGCTRSRGYTVPPAERVAGHQEKRQAERAATKNLDQGGDGDEFAAAENCLEIDFEADQPLRHRVHDDGIAFRHARPVLLRYQLQHRQHPIAHLLQHLVTDPGDRLARRQVEGTRGPGRHGAGEAGQTGGPAAELRGGDRRGGADRVGAGLPQP